MTQKDKNLILQDLCGRLLYGVKIHCVNWDSDSGTEFSTVETVIGIDSDFVYTIWDKTGEKCKHSLKTMSFKPYLRKMDLGLMDNEEIEEYRDTFSSVYDTNVYGEVDDSWHEEFSVESYNWLNKNMYDLNELIPKGLAKPAPEGMYIKTYKN